MKKMKKIIKFFQMFQISTQQCWIKSTCQSEFKYLSTSSPVQCTFLPVSQLHDRLTSNSYSSLFHTFTFSLFDAQTQTLRKTLLAMYSLMFLGPISSFFSCFTIFLEHKTCRVKFVLLFDGCCNFLLSVTEIQCKVIEFHSRV